jgi:hypothetical protein
VHYFKIQLPFQAAGSYLTKGAGYGRGELVISVN